MSKIAAIIGRILLAIIFIVSGITKLLDVGGTEDMITSVGLPSGFAILAGITELVAGLCLAVGFMVRLVALLLFVFVGLTILLFHNQFTDPVEGVAALKNLAIMGGLLLAFAHSHMWSHYYTISRERKSELASRDTEARLHEAELRAARAEARAEAIEERGGTTVADTDGDGTTEVHRRRRYFDW